MYFLNSKKQRVPKDAEERRNMGICFECECFASFWCHFLMKLQVLLVHNLCEWYIILLMERNKKRIQWTEDETQLLVTLYPLYDSKKWKRIAEKFKEESYQRSEIEIREKWINFIDPTLNKNEWEGWELEKLYDIHDQVGTKWCVIQKFIGRTQNMIKNRFYGTLRNYIRFLINFLGVEDESFNERISKLSPKFLNDIYKAENQFRFLGEEIKETIYTMHFKIDKKVLADRILLRKNLYERLKNNILKIFKQIEDKLDAKLTRKNLPLTKIISMGEKIEEQAELKYSQRSIDFEMEQNEIMRSIIQKEAAVVTYQLGQNYYPFLNYNPLTGYASFLPFL